MKKPEHPLTVIKRDYVDTNRLSYQAVQYGTGIPYKRIKKHIEQRKYFSPIEAVCLARFFGEEDDHFLVLQARHWAACISNRGYKQVKNVRPLNEVRAMTVRRRRRKTPEKRETESVDESDKLG